MSVIVVQFSAALEPAAAENLANYSLTASAGTKKAGANKRVALALARYDSAAHTISLTPRKPLTLTPSQELRLVAAGLVDAGGRSIGFMALLSKRAATIVAS
jgi:hypothetical protein